MSNDHDVMRPQHRAGLLLAAAAAATLLGAPLGAAELVTQSLPPLDPIQAWAEQTAPRNRFFINNNEDVEVIRFKKIHDVELCAAAAHDNVDGNVAGYPIKAMWDDQTATIAPGNCLAFDAQSVKVRAASPLPQDIILTGTFRVVK